MNPTLKERIIDAYNRGLEKGLLEFELLDKYRTRSLVSERRYYDWESGRALDSLIDSEKAVTKDYSRIELLAYRVGIFVAAGRVK